MKPVRNHPTAALMLVTAVSCIFNFPDFLYGGTPSPFCLLLSLLYLGGWSWYAIAFGREKGKRRLVLVWNGLTMLTAVVTLCAGLVDGFLMEHLWPLYILELFLVLLFLTPVNGLELAAGSIPATLAVVMAAALILMLLCLRPGKRS